MTNGFEGWVGEFYVQFEPVESIYKGSQDNCTEYFPWAVFLGSNGNLEMFVLDKRVEPSQFGLLPFIGGNEDFLPLGTTFLEFLSRLKDGTAFS